MKDKINKWIFGLLKLFNYLVQLLVCGLFLFGPMHVIHEYYDATLDVNDQIWFLIIGGVLGVAFAALISKFVIIRFTDYIKNRIVC